MSDINQTGKYYFFVGNITDDNAFPHPPTECEEKALFKRFELGYESAKTELIIRNLRLVVHIVKKFNYKGNYEDTISIGLIGLIKAIETFDNTKGIRLATYASRCIENEILMHIRSCLKIKSEVSLEFPIGSDKRGSRITLLDILSTDIDCVHDEVESSLSVKGVFELIELILDDRERLIIKLRYCLEGKRKTQVEIAKALGISRSYVSRIEKKALNKLKKAIEADKIN